MTWPAVLNTALAVLAAFTAGAAIAIMGNNVGRRTGKRKLVVFGLRPKHTATLITVLTGGCIAVATLLVSLALSGQMEVIKGGLADLEHQIEELQRERDRLLRSRVPFQTGDPLALQVVEPGLPPDRLRGVVESILRTAEASVRQRYYQELARTDQSPVEPEGSLLRYDPAVLGNFLANLGRATLPQAVQIAVAENVSLEGGRMAPVPVTFQAVSVAKVYAAGEVIARTTLEPSDPELLRHLVYFVHDTVPRAAIEQRQMPSNPVTGTVDVAVGDDLPILDWTGPVLQAVAGQAGPVALEARAARDLYSLGRLDVRLVAPDLRLEVPPPGP